MSEFEYGDHTGTHPEPEYGEYEAGNEQGGYDQDLPSLVDLIGRDITDVAGYDVGAEHPVEPGHEYADQDSGYEPRHAYPDTDHPDTEPGYADGEQGLGHANQPDTRADPEYATR